MIRLFVAGAVLLAPAAACAELTLRMLAPAVGCPGSVGVAANLRTVLRGTRVTLGPGRWQRDEATVEIFDRGERFLVRVGDGDEQEFVDPERSCAEREVTAAAYIAEATRRLRQRAFEPAAPPPFEPPAAAAPRPRARALWRPARPGYVAALALVAAPLGTERAVERALGGGALRVAVDLNALASVSFGVAAMQRVTYAFQPLLDGTRTGAALLQFPLDVSLGVRFGWSNSRLVGEFGLGPLVGVLQASGFVGSERSTYLSGVTRVAVSVLHRLAGRLLLTASVGAYYVPRPVEILSRKLNSPTDPGLELVHEGWQPPLLVFATVGAACAWP